MQGAGCRVRVRGALLANRRDDSSALRPQREAVNCVLVPSEPVVSSRAECLASPVYAGVAHLDSRGGSQLSGRSGGELQVGQAKNKRTWMRACPGPGTSIGISRTAASSANPCPGRAACSCRNVAGMARGGAGAGLVMGPFALMLSSRPPPRRPGALGALPPMTRVVLVVRTSQLGRHKDAKPFAEPARQTRSSEVLIRLCTLECITKQKLAKLVNHHLTSFTT